MSRGMAHVHMLGNVGGDPVVKTTRGGKAVCELRVAVNHSLKRGDTWDEEADWHTVVLWERLAEVAMRFIQKGSQILVVGTLRVQTWQDNQGQKRSKSVVQAEELYLLSRLGGDQGDQGGQGGQGGQGEEIPF